jgi:AcrR family transcriptional regulator
MTPPVAAKRNPERTKGRLLKAAIHLFSARGFHGVSVDEIVGRAGTNKRMVYHYYGSKNGIYLAALVEVFSRLAKAEIQVIEETARPDEKLKHLLAANFKFLDANPEFVRLLLWENLAQGRHVGRHPELVNKNPFMDRFRATINEGVASGMFRAPRDIKHLLINFIAICFIYYSNHYSLSISLGVDLDSPRNRALRLTQATELVFRGLMA